jgi:RHS repeat-associated protein
MYSTGEGSIRILPGQYFDKETNLHYNTFRDYDPAIGRYVQPDPLGVLSTTAPTPTTGLNHLYGYANQNPLGESDPLGLWSVTIELYPGVGGGFVFGNHPQGGRFMSARYGLGFGGGISYDPDGNRPGAETCQTGVGGGVTLNSQAAFGPLFAGGNLLSAGVNANADPGNVFRGYLQSGPQTGYQAPSELSAYRGLDWRRWGFRASGNASLELTGFKATKESCECRVR